MNNTKDKTQSRLHALDQFSDSSRDLNNDSLYQNNFNNFVMDDDSKDDDSSNEDEGPYPNRIP